MNAPQILSTKDYTIFKQVNFNRDKVKSHLLHLKNLITKENLLHLHPIIVNSEMEVIDGQHRLEVAKELELEVFYIQSMDVSYQHILDSNSIQRQSKISDIIKFYSNKEKNIHYSKCASLLKKTGLQPKAFFYLIFGFFSKALTNLINSGKLSLPESMEEIEKVCELYARIKEWAIHKHIRPIGIINSAYFTSALRELYVFGVDEKTLIDKIDARWFELKPQPNKKEWLIVLQSIYNFRNSSPICINI